MMAAPRNLRMMSTWFFTLLLILPSLNTAFVAIHQPRSPRRTRLMAFQILVDLPGQQIQALVKCEPLLSVSSELVEVRYKIPFGLDVAPSKGLAVCNKDGPGGEKVGDILRFTSQWALGLPRGDGIDTTVASFAGGLFWQVSMFDVQKAVAWELVVQALVSNSPERTDEVVLLFERALEGTPPELQ